MDAIFLLLRFYCYCDCDIVIFCNIINPQCPRALLQVSYLQFHGITYPLFLVPFVSLLGEFGAP